MTTELRNIRAKKTLTRKRNYSFLVMHPEESSALAEMSNANVNSSCFQHLSLGNRESYVILSVPYVNSTPRHSLWRAGGWVGRKVWGISPSVPVRLKKTPPKPKQPTTYSALQPFTNLKQL